MIIKFYCPCCEKIVNEEIDELQLQTLEQLPKQDGLIEKYCKYHFEIVFNEGG